MDKCESFNLTSWGGFFKVKINDIDQLTLNN